MCLLTQVLTLPSQCTARTDESREEGTMPRTMLAQFIALQILFACSSYAQKGNFADYFPMHLGDTWFYNSPPPPSSPWNVKTIRDSLPIGNRTFYTWTYGDGVDIIDTLRSDSVGNIWKYSGGKEYLMFDFHADSGATYRYELGHRFGDSVYYYTVWVWTNISGSTPAGVFENCIRFLFDISQVVDEEVLYTFAPNVGLIIQQNDGWWTMRLTSAIINGETVVSVDESDHTASKLQFLQNYPNPFNPSTKIQFSIVNRQWTIVKVFDVLGREVATLVNEVKEPGIYTVQWDAKGIASGVYLYRLQAGNFVETKKLVLLR